MKEKGLVDFFEQYLEQESIFKNKNTLQIHHTPKTILHRDEQVQQVARILAPCLKSEKPSNVFIYGKTGTGKTLAATYVANHLKQVASEKNVPIKVISVNCKLKQSANTEYRLFAQLLREFGKIVPPTGLPTEEIYRLFYNTIDQEDNQVVLILDEIDEFVQKTGDNALYNLTRINAELAKAKLTIVGISNSLMFTETLDPRVKSSLSQEEIIFPPYNAMQIQAILRARADEAFRKNAVEDGVIEKCAAYAAREHGDARRALDLLRVAGELVERDLAKKITTEYVDQAENKIERDRVIDAIASHPKHHHAVMYAILSMAPYRKTLFTGEVYAKYQGICSWGKLRPLTQRRVSDILAELDMLGLISAPIISKGRYGRTRQIQLSLTEELITKIKSMLQDSLALPTKDD